MEIDLCTEDAVSLLTTRDWCSNILIRSPRPDTCVALVTQTTQLPHSLASATRCEDSAYATAYVTLTYLPKRIDTACRFVFVSLVGITADYS
jgi:hypothetical protein